MTCMDIWLLLCMGMVFLAVAEYALILRMCYRNWNETDKKRERLEMAKKIDSWAIKIFIGLYIMTVSTYFYCINTYA